MQTQSQDHFRRVRGNAVLALAIAILLFSVRAPAFSLVGPYTDWMTPSIGYQEPANIGGPMNLGEEYRWNTPIVTYGFDQSFIDYFGAAGVKTVEEAIRVLNNLPAASRMVVTNFPLDSRRWNPSAAVAGVYDLKSMTLALLLEQLGLTHPGSCIFNLRTEPPDFLLDFPSEALWPDGTIPQYVILRNFDPVSLAPSSQVNGVLFTGFINEVPSLIGPDFFDVLELAVDPLNPDHTGVADLIPGGAAPGLLPGEYVSGLTRDDAGGLRYLLSKNNVNFEPPPAGTVMGGPGLAARPGVEKIKFMRHPFLSRQGHFVPMGIRVNSSYVQNEKMQRQNVRRSLSQPDILFRAAVTTGAISCPFTVTTGTDNWQNNAAVNGNPAGAGPGVIQPPVIITFHKLGPAVYSVENSAATFRDRSWGSFNSATNPPRSFPRQDRGDVPLTIIVRSWFTNASEPDVETLTVPVPLGTPVMLQSMAPITDWQTEAGVVNRGYTVEWFYQKAVNSPRFFRAVPLTNPPSGSPGGTFGGVVIDTMYFPPVTLVGTPPSEH